MEQIIPIAEQNQLAGHSQVRAIQSLSKCYLTKDTPRNVQVATANKVIGCSLALISAERPSLLSYEECVHSLARYLELTVEHDVRPTISGMAAALGLSRSTFLNACATGTVESFRTRTTLTLPAEVMELFISIRDNYVSMIEGFMEEGVIHPTCGIFLLKNNGEYKDVVEQKYTVTKTVVDVAAMASKYNMEIEGL